MTNSKIEWCHHTFNPWRGCSKVSAGCDHCYAETMSKRNPSALGVWGDDGKRVIASESYWKLPLRWNAESERTGERARVFCASLADVFEERLELCEPRERLFRLIQATPYLDWLLLTKRPHSATKIIRGWREAARYPGVVREPKTLPNIWLGVSVEDTETAVDRIPFLLGLRGPAVRFLSVEPMLGFVGLVRYMDIFWDGTHWQSAQPPGRPMRWQPSEGWWTNCGIDWVICGGESGPDARPFDLDNARELMRQCRAAGVPFFMKQLGARPFQPAAHEGGTGYELQLRDQKGGDPSEWPEDLRVREIPLPAVRPGERD